MAMEALKSAGIKAYQGSSPKPAVQTVDTAVTPQASAMAKDIKTVGKAVATAEAKPAKKPVKVIANRDSSSKVQEMPLARESAKASELVLPESMENAEGTASNDKLKRAVEEINKKAADSEAVFGVHDSTNRVTIKIVDKKTKEVLKEYPPEKTLDMIAKVWELAGLLVDEKR